MTHEEAIALLPVYALGALEDDVDELRSHLAACSFCQEELAGLLETTTALAEAVEAQKLPDALRKRVMAGFPSPPRARIRSRIPWWSPRGRFALSPAVLVLLVVSLGLTAWVWTEQGRLRAARTELSLSARGLALLTSTETSVVRLQPVAADGSRAHGHWYHHAGIDTQVLVIEFMPALPRGEEYFGWLHHADGTWRPAGSFRPDRNGYGRLILPGDDGSSVDSVRVTRQTRSTSGPENTVVLRWPS